jgi:hypothetical protein
MLEFRFYKNKKSYEILVSLTKEESEQFCQIWDFFDPVWCSSRGYVHIDKDNVDEFNEGLQEFYKQKFERAIENVITDTK